MKKTIYLTLVLITLLLPGIAARSAALNGTMPELDEFTTVDTPMEFTQTMNNITGGILGMVMLLVIAAVSYVVSLFFTNDVRKSAIMTAFVGTVIALLMRITLLISDRAFLFCLGCLFAAVGYGYMTRR